MTRFASKKLLAIVSLFFLCAFTQSQTPTNTTVYIYDELGRLKAIITPSGDAAVYAYDAAGNIVSITRQLSTTVSFIEFTPDQGPAGTSVTIYGTGFSLTANQNSVAFNGVAGTVTAASGTQLIAVVPAGASTGPITVTTPTGSATSTGDFEVLQSLSITGFTPTIGTPGTAVQISGTDFDPVAGNNQLKFNITSATASAATATTINTTVPAGATSGHITVTTAASTAVSSGDFFVPPSPFTAASVDHASRIAIGETKPLSVNAANRIAMLVFDGSAGQRISLQATGSTISSSTVRVVKPDGTNLFNPTSLSGNWFIDTLTLTVSGTHTIIIDPNSTFTGSMNLTLHNVPADVTATITAGGPAVTVTTTTPGQNANVTFEGTTGQRVSLLLDEVTISSSTVTILKPDGTTLVTVATMGTSGWFFDTMSLPATGTYSLLINPKVAATGSVTLSLYNVPTDSVGMIVIGGPPVDITVNTPGQNAQLTFTGTARQIVQVDTFVGTLSLPFPTPSLITKPDGSVLSDEDYGHYDDNVYQLPVTGTYTMHFDPVGSSTGSKQVIIWEIPQPITGIIEIDGAPLTVTFPSANQTAYINFNGTAGQRVSLEINDVRMGQDQSFVALLDPAGNELNFDFAFPESFFIGGSLATDRLIDVTVLPTTGVYTIKVWTGYDSSGSLTLTLYNVPPSVTAPITPGGPPVSLTTTVPGQNATFTFNGTAGQRINLKITESIYPLSDVFILRPNNSVLSGSSLQTDLNGGFREDITLPDTGTSTIVVDAHLGWAGTTTLELYNAAPMLTGTAAIGGPPVTLTATVPGQDAEVTFSATAGQRLSLKVSGTLPVGSDIFIFRPNNQQLTTSKFIRQIGSTRAELFETLVIPATGTHRVRVDTWNDAGTITFELAEVPADVDDGQITIGGPPITVTSTAPRQNRTLSFQGTAGQVVHLLVNNNNSWLNHVWIYKPDGFVLKTRFADAASAKLIEGTTLPQSGTYTIITEFWGTGDSVTLTLGEGLGDVTGTIALDGQPVMINVPVSRQVGRFSFNGTAGQRIGLYAFNPTMPRGFVSLSPGNPDNTFTFLGTESTVQERFTKYFLPTAALTSVVVRPNFDHTGGATVRLNEIPPDTNGTITINGPPVDLTFSPGQKANLTFEGTTGQQVTIHVTNNTAGRIEIEIFKPWGLQQTYIMASGASFDLPVQTLPTPGTYSMVVDPSHANAGSLRISITSP